LIISIHHGTHQTRRNQSTGGGKTGKDFFLIYIAALYEGYEIDQIRDSFKPCIPVTLRTSWQSWFIGTLLTKQRVPSK
jgi:hypothetical protein